MNNVVLIGRITRDPEMRYIPGSEKAVCNMSLAVDRPFKKDETDFFRILVFGKSAENCGKYLTKGSMIGIQGTIQNNNYTTASGEKRYGTDVVADRVEFLDTKKSNASKNSNSSDLPEGFTELKDDEELTDFSDVPF
jgi:single-strand DNA-binding protein